MGVSIEDSTVFKYQIHINLSVEYRMKTIGGS